MKATELLQLNEFYDASEDNVTKHEMTDVRKAKLTLRHLNKLRRRREMKKLEDAKRIEQLDAIYSSASE